MTIETASPMGHFKCSRTSFNNSYTQFRSVVVMLINVDEVFCLISASQHQCKWH